MHAYFGGEGPMSVNYSGSLDTSRIELRRERRESWNRQNDPRGVGRCQPLGDS